ncbi:hypothetical protein BDR05DRAFT_837417, partial [Suillus weaverae]
LCITCDNVSNNDAMIDELAVDLPEFRGQATHTWCFLHTINLVVKAVIHKFD